MEVFSEAEVIRSGGKVVMIDFIELEESSDEPEPAGGPKAFTKAADSESDIRKHLQSAMELIPQGMLEVAQNNIQQVALHTAGMRSHVGVDAAGVWKGGMLHLDLSAIPESHRRGVCVHELAHAAENLPDGSNFAESAEWRKAWAAEIDRSDVPLTQYARTNSSEGFAEFVRFYAEDTADARASFPMATRAVERVYGRL